MKDLTDFFHKVEKLKRVKRTGWVREGVPDPESVAAHCFGITVFCHLLADQLKIDKDKIVKMALVHDLAEAGLGDIVVERGSEVVLSRKQRTEKEKIFLIDLFSKIGNGDEYLSVWLEIEEQKTREAIIFRQLDKLEMAFQALEYENDVEPSRMDEFFENTRMHLKEPLLIDLFNELEKRRKKKTN